MSPAASRGDWKGPVGVAAGVVGARRLALWRLPGAGSGGGAGAAPDCRLRAPRRAVVPGSGSAGASASAGVIFLCFLLAILLGQRRALC